MALILSSASPLCKTPSLGQRILCRESKGQIPGSVSIPNVHHNPMSLSLSIECSSRPKKKGTAHHNKTRPKKHNPYDKNRKGPTYYPPLVRPPQTQQDDQQPPPEVLASSSIVEELPPAAPVVAEAI
ncbi:hypothetical protein SUGI_0432690 [Cryptomeria japonica]|nr:hypothetical protein SUGI_0432690 [Cryptomeria japonica]